MNRQKCMACEACMGRRYMIEKYGIALVLVFSLHFLSIQLRIGNLMEEKMNEKDLRAHIFYYVYGIQYNKTDINVSHTIFIFASKNVFERDTVVRVEFIYATLTIVAQTKNIFEVDM